MRLVSAILVLILLTPLIASGLFTSQEATPVEEPSINESEPLVVVSAQGDEVSGGDDSRIVVLNPQTEKIVWQDTTYSQYFDVDPLNDSTLLYTAQTADGTTYAVVQNWRTGKVYNRFEVARGTHDIDSLGNGSFLYTDGRAHSVVRVNGTTGEESVVYDIREHFPPSAGDGDPSSYEGHYSHLNDVDIEDNGSALLISPRNFDRVVLLDIYTKDTIWILGEEDNTDILNRQHNPNLLEQSPPTVLVADSENDRIIEYRKSGENWTVVWSYSEGLQWPRDADRLPNGNTILVDSRYAMEVTPSREVVWKIHIPKFLYDIEYIHLGDEPPGPSMVHYTEEFDDPLQSTQGTTQLDVVMSVPNQIYSASLWVIPWWISPLSFWSGIAAVVILFVWGNFELKRIDLPRPTLERGALRAPIRKIGPMLLGLLATGTLYLSTAPSIDIGDELLIRWWLWDPAFHTIGLISLLEAVVFARVWNRESIRKRETRFLLYVQYALAAALCVMSLGFVFLVLDPFHLRYQISSPLKVLGMSVAAGVFGGRRLNRFLPVGWHDFDSDVKGVVYGLIGLAVLSIGITDVGSQGAFLGLGLLLGLLSHQHYQIEIPDAASALAHGAVAVEILTYLFRLAFITLGTVVLLRLLGLGTIIGIGLRWELLHLLNLTVLALLLLAVLDDLPFR